MKRLLTGVVGASVAFAAIFYFPRLAFFLFCVLAVDWAVFEFVRIARSHTPNAPLALLVVLVPLGAVGVCYGLPRALSHAGGELMVAVTLAVALLAAIVVLLSRAPVQESLVAMGLLSFGMPYFVLPIVSLDGLRRMDPWILLLLVAMVWLGDSAAYYVGSSLGRHKMAPVVSPNKTWEGAAAGFAVGMGAAAVWSWWRFDRLDAPLLLVSAVAIAAAQMGDLVESVMKRGAGVKDSGGLLPDHGGALDRLDALLLGAPVFYLGVQLIDLGPLVE